jgi:hypothetical protein
MASTPQATHRRVRRERHSYSSSITNPALTNAAARSQTAKPPGRRLVPTDRRPRAAAATGLEPVATYLEFLTMNLAEGGMQVAGYGIGGIALLWLSPRGLFAAAALADLVSLVIVRFGLRDRPARGGRGKVVRWARLAGRLAVRLDRSRGDDRGSRRRPVRVTGVTLPLHRAPSPSCSSPACAGPRAG